MARRGIIGGAADAVKSVAGIAIGAAAAAATTAVIESMAKSLTKNEKDLDRALPVIENAVKARVSQPVQEIADRLLSQERKRKPKTKAAAKQRKPAPKKPAAKAPAKRAAKKKRVAKKKSPRRKR